MRQDAVIEIFGKIDDVNVLKELGAAMIQDNASLDFESEFDATDHACSHVMEQAANGEPVALTVLDTSYRFLFVRELCRVHAISYIMQSGSAGDEGFTELTTWSPGMDEETSYVSEGQVPTISFDDLRVLAAGGIEKVNEFIQDVEKKTLRSIVKKMEVTEAVVSDYENAIPKL